MRLGDRLDRLGLLRLCPTLKQRLNLVERNVRIGGRELLMAQPPIEDLTDASDIAVDVLPAPTSINHLLTHRPQRDCSKVTGWGFAVAQPQHPDDGAEVGL